jgi:hypothetical protein
MDINMIINTIGLFWLKRKKKWKEAIFKKLKMKMAQNKAVSNLEKTTSYI